MKKFLFIMAAFWGFAISVVATDYFLFRVAGGRFTASHGVELCEAHRSLADHVGYEGPRPVCDYPERHR